MRWVSANRRRWSRWNRTIWELAEPAWREYRSTAWYVERLRLEGFTVEEGSGGMPTAFSATWSSGKGATVPAYAEYDAVPGNCQIADTYRAPRPGLSRFAAGHTDPHSALGIGSLTGLLGAKAAMEAHGIRGTLRFTGEPAEKVRGSKPIHAACGYYDGLDAAVSFHPFYMLPLCNTCRFDTHCGPYYGIACEFLCEEPETWLRRRRGRETVPIPQSHTAARAPGATDAVVAMYTLSKMLRDHMLPHAGTWTVNEAILASGQATADNLAAGLAVVMYAVRAPTVEMLDRCLAVLGQNADAAARASHCRVRRHWVSRSAPGLANHAIADVAFRNLQLAGLRAGARGRCASRRSSSASSGSSRWSIRSCPRSSSSSRPARRRRGCGASCPPGRRTTRRTTTRTSPGTRRRRGCTSAGRRCARPSAMRIPTGR